MKTVRIFYVILIAVLLLVIVSLRYAKFHQHPKYQNSNTNVKSLMREVDKLTLAFAKKDAEAVYNLFNSAFRNETSFDEFNSAFSSWFDKRKFVRMKIQHAGASFRTGYVSCLLEFHKQQDIFLYQSWIKTGRGWQLVWLNKLLPREMLIYGENDKRQLQKIKQRSLDELLTNNLIALITGDVEIPKNIFVKTDSYQTNSDFFVPGYTIREMPLKDIIAQAASNRALFWLEFATVRIIEDIASIYIDVHPLYRDIPKLTRTRGIQLYFIHKDNHWYFDSPVSRW